MEEPKVEEPKEVKQEPKVEEPKGKCQEGKCQGCQLIIEEFGIENSNVIEDSNVIENSNYIMVKEDINILYNGLIFILLVLLFIILVMRIREFFI